MLSKLAISLAEMHVQQTPTSLAENMRSKLPICLVEMHIQQTANILD
jgi:hypothetical protein